MPSSSGVPMSAADNIPKLKSRVGAAQRWHPDDPQTHALHVEYRAVSAEEQIRRLVDAAPPLTPEVRARLAVLLLGGAVA